MGMGDISKRAVRENRAGNDRANGKSWPLGRHYPIEVTGDRAPITRVPEEMSVPNVSSSVLVGIT